MGVADYVVSCDNQLDINNIDSSFIKKNSHFLNNEQPDFPKNTYAVAILGVPDNPDATTFYAANQVRFCLHSLVEISNGFQVMDLGNIRCGSNFNETCDHISEVVIEITRANTKIVLLGGSSKFHLGCIIASQKNNIPLNMVCIDSEINPEIFAPSYINDFAEHDDFSAMFNYTNIGYQSYMVERKTIDLIEDLHFEAYRLGSIRNNIKEMEPVIRDSNLLNFSLNAVKYADAPGTTNPSPNGLTGDEACQLSLYTGHSNRITSFGLYDLNANNDPRSITAKLAAQIVWYLFEGISNRIAEEPDTTPENFTKYIIHHNQTDQNISFYRSTLTNRWWMEIANSKTENNILLSCSESDYELACKQEIPERWWRTYQRLNF